MTDPAGALSVIDFAAELPTGRRTVEQLAASSGLAIGEVRRWVGPASFPVVGPEETIQDVAARAVARVRDARPAEFAAVRTVLVGGAGPWAHPVWSPSAAIADEFDLREAHCVEVGNFCNSTAAVLRVALDAAIARPAEGNTLIVLQDHLSSLVDETSPAGAELFNYADGAVALLVGTGAGRGRFDVVDAVSVTDPSWHAEYVGEYRRDGRGPVLRRTGNRRGLRDRYVAAFSELVHRVIDKGGRDLADVALVLLNHGDQVTHERLLDELGLPRERSWFSYEHLAHQGAADTFIALDSAIGAGRVPVGSYVLQLTSGLGFSWGATLLRAVRP
ncbi:MAG TPA: 3-oxoacyl-[acyl-carrier-protein] synthase III C-terminal domain-containing protein [Pseudonocardiaceae bacterium]